MKTFELVYTIEAASSWRGKESIKIKSNIADDKLVDCELSQSLVDYLKKEAVILDPDKLLLTIAEAQKREIQTNLENMDDMAIQAKVHAEKAHKILTTISEEAEKKYEEIEKKFSDTEKRFKDKMVSTSESIKTHLEKLSSIEEKLTKIDNWKLEKLTESIQQIIKLVKTDPELVKLVLDYKKA
jgi:hypothetical protein